MFAKYSRASLKSSRPPLLLALLSGALFAGAASVFAVTTIGANISTGGTLTVTGQSALNGGVALSSTTPWGLFSINPNGVSGPAFAIGSSTKTDFVVTNAGYVGVGTVSPSFPLSVVRKTSASGLVEVADFAQTNSNAAVGNETGIGIGNGAALISSWINAPGQGGLKFYGSVSDALFERLVIQGAGNVGIGTTTPWAQLSINPIATNGTAPSFVIGSSTATNFVVTNAGNVGIGTANPLDLLTMTKNAAFSTGFGFSNSTAGGGVYFYLAGDAGGSVELDYTPASQPVDALIDIASSAVIRTSNSASGGLVLVAQGASAPIRFGTGGFALSNERMRITSTGSVGIGTTSPAKTFATNGDGFFSSSATTTLYIHSSGGSKGGCIQLTGANGTQYRAYATTTGPLMLEVGSCQ